MLFDVEQTEQELTERFRRELGATVRLRIATAAAPEDELSEGEKSLLGRFEQRSRQVSFLRGRHALKRLLFEAGRSTDSSSISFPNAEYSITHAGEIAIALALEPSQSLKEFQLCGVGIDLEFERQMQPQSARFFLTDREAFCRDHDHDQEYLLRLWTVKEAMFKSDPENCKRRFANYETADPQLWCGHGKIVGDGASRIRYSSVILQNGFLSAAVFGRLDARLGHAS